MLLEEFEKSISPVTYGSDSGEIMDKILNEEPGKLPDVLRIIKSALPKNLNNIHRTCDIGNMLSVIMSRFPEKKLATWEVFKEFYRQQSDKKEQVRLLFYANENLWEHTVVGGGKFLQTDNVTTKMSNDLMEMMSNSNFSAEELKSELWPTASLSMILHYTPKHAAQVVSLLEKAFAPQKLNEDTWMLKNLTKDILEANPKLADRLIKSGISKDFINKKITDLKAEGRFKEEAKPVQTEIDHKIEKVRKRIENPRLSGVVIADKIVEDMKKGVVITPDKGRELAAKYKRQYALDKKQNSKSL